MYFRKRRMGVESNIAPRNLKSRTWVNSNIFKKKSKTGIEVYTDSDWAGCPSDKKSTTGYCSFVWTNLVTWRSKKQPVVAMSSVEDEFRAMAQGICKGIWLKRMLDEIIIPINYTIRILCDNKVVISIAKNPVHHDKTGHVEID